MSPAASPWGFLVPAIGAFLGVVLAQWWTSRREKRQWENQMKMYSTQRADQRERDSEQREDQRQRDHELWVREDRHRFASEKRGVYAEYLSNTNKAVLAMRFTARLLDEEAQRQGEDRERPIADRGRWLRENRVERDLSEPVERLGDTLNVIRLLAPPPVVKLAEAVFDSLYGVDFYVAGQQQEQENRRRIDQAITQGRTLRAEMRNDLGVDRPHDAADL